MQEFISTYLAEAGGAGLEIIDLGAHSVDGSDTYRSLFGLPGWHYRGLDLVAGRNVDVVVADPYRWLELADASIDVVVSGQTLEHIEYPWLTLSEIARVLRPGGVACLIAPAGGPEHRFPVDCWRIYPDGMRALARHAGLREVEIFTDWNQSRWKDTFAVLQKPHADAPGAGSPLPVLDNRGVAGRASTPPKRRRKGLSALFRKQ
jgi:SAM-dependent methyltransferase